jgi:hypothetical protein
LIAIKCDITGMNLSNGQHQQQQHQQQSLAQPSAFNPMAAAAAAAACFNCPTLRLPTCHTVVAQSPGTIRLTCKLIQYISKGFFD